MSRYGLFSRQFEGSEPCQASGRAYLKFGTTGGELAKSLEDIVSSCKRARPSFEQRDTLGAVLLTTWQGLKMDQVFIYMTEVGCLRWVADGELELAALPANQAFAGLTAGMSPDDAGNFSKALLVVCAHILPVWFELAQPLVR